MKHHTFSGTKLLAVERAGDDFMAVRFSAFSMVIPNKDAEGLTIGKTYDVTIKERPNVSSKED